MTADFSWAQFAWITVVFVGAPALVCALLLWRRSSVQEDATGPGRLGLLSTGSAGFVFGFVSCAGWLTWSAPKWFQ